LSGWTEGNHRNSQAGEPISRHTFEAGTSWMQSRIADCFTAAFYTKKFIRRNF
jgi:hypothetical protein